MTITRRFALALLMVAGMVGLLATEAAASHFRGSTVEPRIVSTNLTATSVHFDVRWTVTTVWRRSYLQSGSSSWGLSGFPQVGDVIAPNISDTEFDFGDGSTPIALSMTVIAVDSVEDWIVARQVLPRSYAVSRTGTPPVRTVHAFIRGCCRLLDLVDDNWNRGFIVAGKVVLDAGRAAQAPPNNVLDQGPTTGLPTVITVIDPPHTTGATTQPTFSVPAVDPEGGPLTFALRNDCDLFVDGPDCTLGADFGLSMNAATGVVTWTINEAIRNESLQGLRATQYTVTDPRGNFVAVDTLMSLVRTLGPPPVITLDGQADPLVLDVALGESVSFTVGATASRPATLSTSGVPVEA